MEERTAFEIRIAGERIYIPPHPVIEFEYERDEDEEEVEIELKWKRKYDITKLGDRLNRSGVKSPFSIQRTLRRKQTAMVFLELLKEGLSARVLHRALIIRFPIDGSWVELIKRK